MIIKLKFEIYIKLFTFLICLINHPKNITLIKYWEYELKIKKKKKKKKLLAFYHIFYIKK